MKLKFACAFQTKVKHPSGKNYVGVQFEDENKNTWTYYGITHFPNNKQKINVSTSIENREVSPVEIVIVYNLATKWLERYKHPYLIGG